MSDHGELASRVAALAARRILCLGDVMVDRFVYGTVERVSPEAPIPVLSVSREAAMLGGAGNVARNAAALGAEVALVAVAGDDPAGHELTRLIGAEARILPHLVAVPGRATTVKTRFVAHGQQLLRADQEVVTPLATPDVRRVVAAVEAELPEADLLVLSDYAKGVLGDAVLGPVIAAARAAGKPVIADPKSIRFARYNGASLITPNAKELAAATGLVTLTDDQVAEAAARVLADTEISGVLVTRSERGMSLLVRGAAPLHLPAVAREVYDVSGAGDTVLAVVALAVAAGMGLPDAARLANAAAGLVVGKAGTAVVHPDELTDALHAADLHGAGAKVMTRQAAQDTVSKWRARGQSIAFTNGCFDLLHPGHVSLLQEARGQADRLVVGLNTDASVRRLKGEGRPVNAEMARAIVLASLESVDAVVLFDEDTPRDLIAALRPDVLVKGADYRIDQVVGADLVQAYGGRVHLAALKAGHSTTATIARMVR